MAYDVFISYSSKDQKIVEGLSAYLEQNGIRCFVAYRDIPKGIVWAGAITEAIEDCKMMVVVFSEHFNQSDQVDREIEMCSEEKKPILTFKIQDAAFNKVKKYYLKNINWIDAFPNPEECFGKLLESVSKLLSDSMPEKPLPVVKPLVIKTSECLLKIRPNIACEVWIDGEKTILANANQITKIPLNKGTFWMEFVSAENESDKYACEYTIVQTEELLSVDLESIAKGRMEKQETERIAYLEKAELEYFRIDGKFGFKIKETEEIIIQAKYDWVAYFHEGLVAVQLNGKYGFIDKTGNEVIPFKYDYANIFHGGLAVVQLNGKYGYINKDGKEVTPFKYDYASGSYEGLAKVQLNKKYGYIDKDGKEVILLKYDYAHDFCEGLAAVGLDGKYGFIDKAGKEVIPLKYNSMETSFREGLAAVKLNGKWGYIDKAGKEVIPFRYDSAKNFYEGLSAVGLNGKYGFIDKAGKEMIPFKYDSVPVYRFCEDLAAVGLDGKYGFIDKAGKEVIPFKYDYAYCFMEGLAAVKLNGKWGYIDKAGKEVIPFEYDSTIGFSNSRTLVKINQAEFYIDKSGNRL